METLSNLLKWFAFLTARKNVHVYKFRQDQIGDIIPACNLF